MKILEAEFKTVVTVEDGDVMLHHDKWSVLGIGDSEFDALEDLLKVACTLDGVYCGKVDPQTMSDEMIAQLRWCADACKQRELILSEYSRSLDG